MVQPPMFLDEKQLEKYIHRDISFFIKLWSQEPDLQNKYVRGALSNYSEDRDAALRNLENLGFMEAIEVEIDGAPRRLTRVGADILVMQSNLDEIPKIFRSCREHNINA